MKYLVEIEDGCRMKPSTSWEIIEFSDGNDLRGKILEQYNCMSGIVGSGTSVCTDECPAYDIQRKIINIEYYSAERAKKLGLVQD